ncbi:MAG: hypothetical protein CVV64_16695 [Candidatus Wallbacteria bacterium HGW-Wallbacteria-1]|uniref:Uncharacterized protein n=1 Tax=Candidatus Wallbacteria bacterium HGW-Wallbacteria-1 TaxID=2013854 RepID=A0A2N1PKS8_9BACT|nr:MAG: hypothetical protein CVV64_16695 [Candidatus Wallbacteria bacterium HGW-Wallbacteria-1]
MDELVKGPLFLLSGWIFTVIGGIIAIIQAIANRKLKRTISEKDSIISDLQIQINSYSFATGSRTIAQGDKSQYIESTSAPINIDIGK